MKINSKVWKTRTLHTSTNSEAEGLEFESQRAQMFPASGALMAITRQSHLQKCMGKYLSDNHSKTTELAK